MSEIFRKEKKYQSQLELLSIIAYIDLSGFDTIESYLFAKQEHFKFIKPLPMVAPAIIRNVNAALKQLNWDISNYKAYFNDTITASLTPAHVFGIEKSLEIICAYLEGNEQRGERLLKSGVRNFMANNK